MASVEMTGSSVSVSRDRSSAKNPILNITFEERDQYCAEYYAVSVFSGIHYVLVFPTALTERSLMCRQQ